MGRRNQVESLNKIDDQAVKEKTIKLSITQMALGVLIVLAACYIVGWMIFGVPSLLHTPVPDGNGAMTYTDVIPDNEALFTVARYASGLLFGFGLVVLVTGTIQVTQAGKRKTILAILQMISGVLITAGSYLILYRGYPTSFTVPMPEGSEVLRHIFINPGPPIIRAQSLTALIFVLSLLVVGVGMAQFVKAHRKEIEKEL